jgi:hypothetical protein
MTMVRAVPTMRKRRSYMMGSAVYHAGSAPHLVDQIPQTVVVASARPADIKKAAKAAAKAARGAGR